jgi:uncharacterized protein YfiM (DUF2279 family)
MGNEASFFKATNYSLQQWVMGLVLLFCFTLVGNRGHAQAVLALEKATDSLLKSKVELNEMASPTFIVEENLPTRLNSLSISHQFNDSTLSMTQKNRQQRVRLVAGVNIVGYSAVMVGLYHAWYKNYPQSSFHFFNDINEWKGMDKIGHVYSAYAESKASMELWRWTGISRNKRIWIGGMSGAVYQTAIEVLDGFSDEWGWSWGDFAANIAGSGLLVAQELAWDEQRIQMKWSFNRKRYDDPQLNERSNELFGKSLAERGLKDYNGQTYWLSTRLQPFFPKSRIPAWLQISVGTGVEGLFGGYENIGKNDQGLVSFDRTDIRRRRQWYLAPDVDLTRIKTNKKGIKVALQILNIIKFPTPSLEYSSGSFRFNWLHF